MSGNTDDTNLNDLQDEQPEPLQLRRVTNPVGLLKDLNWVLDMFQEAVNSSDKNEQYLVWAIESRIQHNFHELYMMAMNETAPELKRIWNATSGMATLVKNNEGGRLWVAVHDCMGVIGAEIRSLQQEQMIARRKAIIERCEQVIALWQPVVDEYNQNADRRNFVGMIEALMDTYVPELNRFAIENEEFKTVAKYFNIIQTDLKYTDTEAACVDTEQLIRLTKELQDNTQLWIDKNSVL